MEVLILAAGYGQRLLDDARGTAWEAMVRRLPKALLPIGDDTLLGCLIREVLDGDARARVVIVSNGWHRAAFRAWWRRLRGSVRDRVRLLHDPSMRQEDRLGALGDLLWALHQGVETRDGLMVMAADSLFLGGARFAAWIVDFLGDGFTRLLVERADLKRIQGRCGCVQIGDGGQVLSYEEKPKDPLWPWAALPVYIYPADVLALLPIYLAEGRDPDAPGSWIPWLLGKGVTMRALVFRGRRIDCGRLGGYVSARRWSPER